MNNRCIAVAQRNKCDNECAQLFCGEHSELFNRIYREYKDYSVAAERLQAKLDPIVTGENIHKYIRLYSYVSGECNLRKQYQNMITPEFWDHGHMTRINVNLANARGIEARISEYFNREAKPQIVVRVEPVCDKTECDDPDVTFNRIATETKKLVEQWDYDNNIYIRRYRERKCLIDRITEYVRSRTDIADHHIARVYYGLATKMGMLMDSANLKGRLARNRMLLKRKVNSKKNMQMLVSSRVVTKTINTLVEMCLAEEKNLGDPISLVFIGPNLVDPNLIRRLEVTELTSVYKFILSHPAHTVKILECFKQDSLPSEDHDTVAKLLRNETFAFAFRCDGGLYYAEDTREGLNYLMSLGTEGALDNLRTRVY